MKAPFVLLACISILCSIALGCSGKSKKPPQSGTLASVIHECQQAQHDHYLKAGLKAKEDVTENEIERYRVYEGVPNFHMQDCVKERWPTDREADLVEQ